MAERYDVIIIGTGAGGGTLAHTLAPSGKQILLLERGNFLPREMENWTPGARVHRRALHLGRDVARRRRQGVPTAGALLRRRRDEVVRRRAVPVAAAGLRRAAARRRHLARVAVELRRLRAVLHEGRVALRGARQPRRGPHRGSVEQAVPVAGGVARAAHPAALRRPRAARATSRSTRRAASCSTRPSEPKSTCIRCTWCDGYPCLVHAKADAETIAVRPILDEPNVTLLVDAQGHRAGDRGIRPVRSPASSSSAAGSARSTRPTSSS